MKAYDYAIELLYERELRQKAWAASTLLHIVLIAWLLLQPHVIPQPPALTEFVWLEQELPEPTMAAVSPPTAAAPEVAEQPSPTSVPSPARFARDEVEDAKVEPRPQDVLSKDDRLSDRLAALRQSQPQIAVKAPSSRSLLKAPATQTTVSSGAAKQELNRESDAPSQPVEMKRAKSKRSAPRLAQVEAPTEKSTKAAVPDKMDTTVRRNLSGASLAGPAADRPIESYVMPEYPDWAKREGIEGSVMLTFVVLPDGRVKENILVERTSGFSDFDDRAIAALKKWRFEALPPGSTTEQWGSITLHYKLRG